MTKLGDKIKLALDESRMLILGAQVLLGFQYRAVFEHGFDLLPRAAQYAKLVALTTLLVAIALIIWPGSYHRIVRKGQDAIDVHDFTTSVMNLALFPFLLAFGIEVYVISEGLLGFKAALGLGLAIALAAFLLWYGLGFVGRRNHWDTDVSTKDRRNLRVEKTELFAKVEQVLVEARMVLPGVQALLGFQFAIMLIEGFEKLPESSKRIHLASLVLMALCVILLMTPAAYHRIVERGEATEHFHRVASLFVLAAMVPLPLGICGDFFVVVRKISGSTPAAGLSAVAMLALFYTLWFGVTAYRRASVERQRG